MSFYPFYLFFFRIICSLLEDIGCPDKDKEVHRGNRGHLEHETVGGYP